MNERQHKGGCSGIHRDNVLEKFLDVQQQNFDYQEVECHMTHTYGYSYYKILDFAKPN